jgi:hypothetical protein
MKTLLLIFLVLIGSTDTPKLKERIQGNWVCVKILDSKGQPTKGKFGGSSEYLRFSFFKSKLSVSESPYEKGILQDITFKNENSFDWLPNAIYELPERIYVVKELNDNYMSLVTKGEKGDSITYKFLNQKNFSHNYDKQVIDEGILLVKHLRLSKTNKNDINRTYEYQITNDSIFLAESPTFENRDGSFGQMFSYEIKLPKDFKLDKVSDEMILDFDVDEKGASNFNITKGLNNEINTEVIRVMEKLYKNWKPIILNQNPVKTTLRFHLYFYMTISEIKLPWK